MFSGILTRCNCGGRHVVEQGMRICVDCGTSQQHLGDPTSSFGSNSCVLLKSIVYDRRYRFSTHLCRLGRRLYNAPPIDDQVWKVLEAAQPTNVDQILSALRKTGLILNKHYSQLSTFSKVFLKDEIQNMTETEYNKIMCWFDEVHKRWKKQGDRSFFSYNWLLETFIIDTPMKRFLPVLKLLKCSKRRKKYSEKLNSLFPNGFKQFTNAVGESSLGVGRDHPHALPRSTTP